MNKNQDVRWGYKLKRDGCGPLDLWPLLLFDAAIWSQSDAAGSHKSWNNLSVRFPLRIISSYGAGSAKCSGVEFGKWRQRQLVRF